MCVCVYVRMCVVCHGCQVGNPCWELFPGLTTVAGRVRVDPLGQVLKLMDDLADKVKHEGDVEAESFKIF